MSDKDIVDIDISTLDDNTSSTSPIVISKKEEPIKIQDNTNYSQQQQQTNDTNHMNNEQKNVNFGPGIEMLMNTKHIGKQKNTNHQNETNDELKTLEQLEKELEQNMETVQEEKQTDQNNNEHKKVGFISGLFKSSTPTQKEEETKQEDKSSTTNKTWDGFQKIKEIPPVEPDNTIHIPSNTEEKFKEKFKLLKKLEELKRKGIKLTKQYDMESSYLEMKGEYETIVSEKEKQNSIKFQGQLLTTIVNGIEFLNDKIDPIDLKLKGWSESIAENIQDYDEIFEQLHEKYKTKYSMAPELKLFFQIISSAVTVHFTNTMFSSITPNVENIFKQNPDLAREFTKATVDSMKTQSPGFSNFMNDMTQQQQKASQPQPQQKQAPEPLQQSRVDMRGPSNIDDLLSKIRKPPPPSSTTSFEPKKKSSPKQNSYIKSSPKQQTTTLSSSRKSRLSSSSRRKRTERNIVSLDM